MTSSPAPSLHSWLCVRHAQSASNADASLTCKIPSPINPLTEKGEQQTTLLAAFLGNYLETKDAPPLAVFCSSFTRALHTRDVTLQRLNELNIPYLKFPPTSLLREIDKTETRRFQRDDFGEHFPHFARELDFHEEHACDYFVRYPGGESLADVEMRMRQFHMEVETLHRPRYGFEHCLVFGHGGSIRVLFNVLLGQTYTDYETANPANTSVRLITNGIDHGYLFGQTERMETE